MQISRLLAVVFLIGLIGACRLTQAPATSPPESPSASQPSPTERLATETVTPDGLIDNPEAIFLRSPGSGSRVASPLTVIGEADSTFEQTLVARLLLLDGTELAFEPILIGAPLGERGPFEGQLEFEVDSDQQAVLQVLSTSPRDGGLTHVSSVIITLVPAGFPENITTAEPHRERIIIESPAPGEEISGGEIQVFGIALPSFEGTLVVRLIGPDGDVMVEEPLIVDAPDIGQYGTFQITLSYEIEEPIPARVLVTDPSPAFGGHNHVNSVEVRLTP